MEISEEKKKELLELVKKQKKAKISWVKTITQLSEEQIISVAPMIGLTIDKDQIMSHSETNEGKKEIQIEKNIEKLIQQALDERVLREYFTGNNDKEAIALAARIVFAGSIVGLAGVGLALTSMSKPTDPTKLKFGKVETCVCQLDGNINYSVAQTDKMIPAKEHLYKEMKKQYNDDLHYLFPIKSYFEMVVLLERFTTIQSDKQRRDILSLCESLDIKIRNFCNEIVHRSIFEMEKHGKKAIYSVLLPSGERVTTNEKFIPLNQYSLFLSYRTIVNRLYYELVQSSKLPSLPIFVQKNHPSQYHLIEQHIQYIFKEFANLNESQGLTDISNIVQSILKTP